eukprot:12529781-Prorocentrum_lima.AAC.1
MVICGNCAREPETNRDSTSTQNVDIGLLRMMLSMTNGKTETLTTTDISRAFSRHQHMKAKRYWWQFLRL